MNKDNSLKTNDQKIVLLMVGNDDTGKKTLTKQWMNKYTSESEENRTFYKVFNFFYNDTIEEEEITILIEIRIMNGDEIETDLKVNSSFFKGALGAFVVTSIDEFMSFQDGIKWKEKIDLMCVLPNRFPLPVNLIINKCDKVERIERRPWLEKIQLDNYVKENQFFNHFFVSSENKNSVIVRESVLSNQSVDVESPLKDLIRTIFQFKDIKEKLLNGNKTVNKLNQSKINSKDINSSLISYKSNDKKKKIDNNCSIL